MTVINHCLPQACLENPGRMYRCGGGPVSVTTNMTYYSTFFMLFHIMDKSTHSLHDFREWNISVKSVDSPILW
jgi:hypothetical protein